MKKRFQIKQFKEFALLKLEMFVRKQIRYRMLLC